MAKEDYALLACEKLGLALPGEKGHHIGTFRYLDLPEDVISSLAIHRLNAIDPILHAARPHPPRRVETDAERAYWKQLHIRWCARVRASYFLHYSRFLYLLKNIKSYEPRGWRDAGGTYEEVRNAVAECHLKYDLYKGGKYNTTFAGWLRYLKNASPNFYAFLRTEAPARLKESDRRMHHYLCGSTGSGKTEALKAILFSYLQHYPDCALVIIEPSGKLSTEVGRWTEARERLVYITVDTERGLAPCINPLTISGIEPSDTSPQAIDMRRIIADELVDALAEVIRASGDLQFTVNMEAVLRACLITLLNHKGATFDDLVRFMVNSTNRDLVEKGKSLGLHYPHVAEFFETKFGDPKHFRPTKEALYAKLFAIFGSGILGAVTCGENTIDLEAEINSRKLIVFDVKRFGPASGPAFGRLIIAMLKAIAMRREGLSDREIVPIHCIIDECHNFVSASVKQAMREARKFGLMLTLCQTEIGAEMPIPTRDAVLNGTNVQMAGATSDWGTVARFIKADEAAVQSLKTGEFMLRPSRNHRPFKVRIRSDLQDNSRGVSASAWRAVLEDQYRRYYRSVSEAARPGSAVEPDEEMAPAAWHG